MRMITLSEDTLAEQFENEYIDGGIENYDL
jgi:hypothetical protein